MHNVILQAILSPPLWEALTSRVTRSADGKGSHITVCVNVYVSRMLSTSLCGMTHTACGQHISWCAAFYGQIRVRSRCACPETKAYSSSRGTAAHCLKIGTGLKRAVSFRPWPIYPLCWPRYNVCQSTASTDTRHFIPSIWTGSLWIWYIEQMFLYVLQCTIYMAPSVYWGWGGSLTVLSFSRHFKVGLYWCALAILSL